MGRGTVANFGRVEAVIELVISGYGRAKIIGWVNERTDWKISIRQIDRLIAGARKRLDEAVAPEHQREFHKALRRLDLLFVRSLEAGDFRTCLAIERERIALLKLGDKPRRGPFPEPAAALALRGSWRAKQAAIRESSNN
jgi:hypothetical protein